jgi:hypothetical protein
VRLAAGSGNLPGDKLLRLQLGNPAASAPQLSRAAHDPYLAASLCRENPSLLQRQTGQFGRTAGIGRSVAPHVSGERAELRGAPGRHGHCEPENSDRHDAEPKCNTTHDPVSVAELAGFADRLLDRL